MELTFRKEGSKHIAEFSATADFNLHLEKEKEGFLFVQQRTSTSGQYDSINGGNFASQDKIVDCDFVGAVYPKYIKIVSEVEPTLAVVTFNAQPMNIVRLNTVSLNQVRLNLVGERARKGGSGSGGGGSDAPEGYGNFITADDMVFAASDSKFYVEL